MPADLQLALLIAILLPAGKILASLTKRFGIPAILSELLVGVAAGPGLLNIMHRPLFSGTAAGDAFLLLAQIGGLVLMFIAGLETDIERMREAGPTAFLVALLGVIWPFFLGAGVAHLLGVRWTSAWFLGGALTATSVSISARTLMDAGKMTSPEASVILGAAVIDDVMGLFVLAFLAAACSAKDKRIRRCPESHAVVPAKHPLGWTASSRHPNESDRHLRYPLLPGRVRRREEVDRPDHQALSKDRCERGGNKLRPRARAFVRSECGVAGEYCGNYRRISARLCLC